MTSLGKEGLITTGLCVIYTLAVTVNAYSLGATEIPVKMNKFYRLILKEIN